MLYLDGRCVCGGGEEGKRKRKKMRKKGSRGEEEGEEEEGRCNDQHNIQEEEALPVVV